MNTSYRKPPQKSRPLISRETYLDYSKRLPKGKEWIVAHGGWNSKDPKVLTAIRAWHTMSEDCLLFMQHYSAEKQKQLQEAEASIPVSPQLLTYNPEEAAARLKKKGFIKLEPGSYFVWIEKDWFEKYKKVLRYQPNGSWIPSLNKLPELEALNIEYEAYQKKQAKIEYAKKMADKQRDEIAEQYKQQSLKV